MKARIVFTILGIMLLGLATLADGLLSPKHLRVNWARVPGDAQIEILLDQLRQAKNSPVEAAIVDQQLHLLSNGKVGSHTELGELNSAIRSNRAVVYADEDRASLELANGKHLQFQKNGDRWEISGLSAGEPIITEGRTRAEFLALTNGGGFSAGQTFLPVAINEDFQIDRLSRQVTRQYLDRELFGAPDKTVSYYTARYTDTAPYVKATYIQLVSDPAWNRILYGSLNRWIKSYEDILRPSALAVDADGRVFVAESGRERILVLQLNPDEEETSLTYSFEISGVLARDIAHSDNGTPLNTDDDVLYVLDGNTEALVKYRLSANGAVKTAEYDEFRSPGALATGRWNGANNHLVYVVDLIGKRIRLLEDKGTDFTQLHEITGPYGQYFRMIKVDHFGSVYAIDNVNSQLYKYSAGLELLDEKHFSEEDALLAGIDVAFGKVSIEGEGDYWVGFDQLFLLERWTEDSGAGRQLLGTAIKNAALQAAADVSEIAAQFTVTDFGEVGINTYDAENSLVREVHSGWVGAGRKTVVWDRRDQQGEQVPPGHYRMEIIAHSPYREESVTLGTEFYLPLFYWQDAGSEVAADDAYNVQGTPHAFGEGATETVRMHPEAVVYHFTGLNPESEYELAIECYAGDSQRREQTILVGNGTDLSTVVFSDEAVHSGYLSMPAAAYENGTLTVRIQSNSDLPAVVSQVWLKETGQGFFVQQSGDETAVVSDYMLEANYPNPFNPSTNIAFQLPRDGRVTLAVYNVLGQRVRVLVDEHRSAGRHLRIWDGRNDAGAQVASGLYFYRLTSGDYVETRRMLLLK